jgi:hypothetical protein
LLLEKLIAAISGDSSFVAAYLFRALALVGVLFICFSMPGLARAHGINPITAVWLGVMNPLVVMHFVAGAHNDALMVGIIFLALRFALSKHFMFAVVLATIALAIKPVAIVLLPFLALMAAGANSNSIRRARYALITGIVSLLTLFAVSALAGTGPFGWLNSLSTPGAVKSWLSPTTAIGMLVGEAIKLFGFGNFVDTSVQISRLIGRSISFVGITPKWAQWYPCDCVIACGTSRAWSSCAALVLTVVNSTSSSYWVNPQASTHPGATYCSIYYSWHC